jgi:uncharacterized protein (TIGR03435 family)
MKRRDTRLEDVVDSHLGLFRSPPADEIARAAERTLRRLRSAPVPASVRSPMSTGTHRAWLRPALVGAAAAVVFVLVLRQPAIRSLVGGLEALAVVESADGGAFRAPGRALRPGDSIEAGEVIRTNGDTGSQFSFLDGSRVEMRARSQLSVERAADGVRLRLSRGGIIVDAAAQGGGHLHVQTDDVLVSVVGTIFVVDAEESGSRVAVIEGEVRVQEGASEKTLLPGQQLATNPAIEARPVKEAIAWSRNAEGLALFLQQLAVVPPPIAPQTPPEPRDKFEVESVRPTKFAPGGGRGSGGGSPRPAEEPCGNPRGTRFPFLQVDGRRFAVNDMTLHGLITLAYGIECRDFRGSDFLLGGPGWIKTDGYDIQALIPDGAPAYTREQFLKGEAPRLQAMLRTLLADRFTLELQRETRAIPVYELTVSKGGHKLTAWKEGDPVDLNDWIPQLMMPSEKDLAQQGLLKRDRRWLAGLKHSIPQLVNQLKSVADRPVLDRTGIVGEFNYQFFYSTWLPPVSFMLQPGASPDAASAPSLFAALEELGLRLEPTRTPVEVLVIERAEKPTGN